MPTKLNRFTALILLILLFPFVLPIKLYRWLAGTGRKPFYPSTFEGDPLLCSGDDPVVVALWATWASVWFAATEQILHFLQQEFRGWCEFVYIEADNPAVREKYKVEVLPAVLAFHKGREVGRFINLLEYDELRRCVAERVADGGPA